MNSAISLLQWTWGKCNGTFFFLPHNHAAPGARETFVRYRYHRSLQLLQFLKAMIMNRKRNRGSQLEECGSKQQQQQKEKNKINICTQHRQTKFWCSSANRISWVFFLFFKEFRITFFSLISRHRETLFSRCFGTSVLHSSLWISGGWRAKRKNVKGTLRTCACLAFST